MKDKIAKYISEITSLYVTVPIFGLLIAWLSSNSLKEFFLWALTFIFFVGLLPMVFIYINVKRGNINDFSLTERTQRGGTLLTSTMGSLLLVLVYKFISVPSSLFCLAIILTIISLVFYLITNYWKISLHAGSFTGMVVLASIVISPYSLFFLLLIPVIAWARVRLHRHTIAQTLVGALVAATLVLVCATILEII